MCYIFNIFGNQTEWAEFGPNADKQSEFREAQ